MPKDQLFPTPLATTTAAGNMSPEEKIKLAGIAAGAEVNVNADWNAVSGDAKILNKPSFFPPATHAHSTSAITGLDAALAAGLTDATTKVNAAQAAAIAAAASEATTQANAAQAAAIAAAASDATTKANAAQAAAIAAAASDATTKANAAQAAAIAAAASDATTKANAAQAAAVAAAADSDAARAAAITAAAFDATTKANAAQAAAIVAAASDATTKANAAREAAIAEVGNFSVAAAVHGAGAKTIPVEADELAMVDSEAGNVLKKFTWLALLTAIKTYLDSFYATLSQLATKAPLENPTFTGAPTAPTAAPGTNTGQLATCAFVLTNSGASNHEPIYRTAAQGSPVGVSGGGPQIYRVIIGSPAAITSSGTVNIRFTGNGVTGSPLTIPVSLTTSSHTSSALIATAIRAALAANAAISALYEVAGTGSNIDVTRRGPSFPSNDSTLSIDALVLPIPGVPSFTSFNLLAGVASGATVTPDFISQYCRVGPFDLTGGRTEHYDWYIAETTNSWRQLDKPPSIPDVENLGILPIYDVLEASFPPVSPVPEEGSMALLKNAAIGEDVGTTLIVFCDNQWLGTPILTAWSSPP